MKQIVVDQAKAKFQQDPSSPEPEPAGIDAGDEGYAQLGEDEAGSEEAEEASGETLQQLKARQAILASRPLNPP